MQKASTFDSGGAIQTNGLLAALFAIATALMLQSSRVFVSYLVFVIDQSQRTTIGLIAVTVFAFPIACWLFVKFARPARIVAASILLLAASRIIFQVVEQPVARLGSSGLAVAGWGTLTVFLVAGHRRPAAAGLILGFGLDLAFRTLRGSLDLPWLPDPFQTAQVVVVTLQIIVLWWRVRDSIADTGTTWRSAGALVIIGPAVAIFHLVTGNVAFVSIHTDLSAGGSSALLAGGMVLGVAIAILRLLAINMIGPGGGPLIGRFILFDAVIGAVALVFAWEGAGLALLGVLFSAVTVTELVLFALTAEAPAPTGRIGPAAMFVTLGMLLQFSALFVYYTATGSGLMLGFSWVGLVTGTLFSALSTTASIQREPLYLRSYVAPAALIGAFLAAAILWSSSDPVSLDARADDAEEITVITYNIQSGFSRDNYWDLEETARVIEGSGADVVVLQEVSRGWLVTTGTDQLRWLSDRLDMPYAWGPASTDDLWGNAVLSRYPIESESVTKFDSTQNLRRSVLRVRLDLGNGGDLTVIATHLDNPNGASEARSEQVEQLIPLLTSDRPTVLAGDFNMTPDNELIADVLETGFVDAAGRIGATEGTSEDGRRIDYIFISGGLDVRGVRVLDTNASDHRPVVARLIMPAP